MDDVDSAMLDAAVGQFPDVAYAVGYGSGVFRQKGYAADAKPMVDLLLCVDAPREWHAENLRRNGDHYSALGRLGASAVASVQERLAAGVYFNTLVPWDGRMIKYGVVSRAALERDLLEWDQLYLAGRLHKPVAVVRDDAAIGRCNARNLEAAVAVARLTLPATFSREQLFARLAALSYDGDVRMGMAENPDKVNNIVSANVDRFEAWYAGHLGEHLTRTGDTFHQDLARREHLRERLPASLARVPVRELAAAVSAVVRRSSRGQTAKALLTAGLVKSVRYAAAKVGKARA